MDAARQFSKQLQAVVFDLDGTLLDTAPEFVEVVQSLRRENGLAPLPVEQVRSVVSDGARAMVSLALDITPEQPGFESHRQRFLAIYAAGLGQASPPFPGVAELVTRLDAAGIGWGVSTNKPSYLAEPLLDRLAFNPPAGSLVCPDHVSRPKPDPEPLLLNCRQLNCDPEYCIYIGDHRRDIDAGRAAGMYTITAAYGYIHADDDPADWGADSVAWDSQDLAALIASAF